MPVEPRIRGDPVMKSPWMKIAAVIVGALLLLFGVGMLMEGSGFTQTGRNSALAYIVALLGAGLIGAAFLGETLRMSNDKLGPFGKVAATGGAAVFVIGLLFIYSMSDSAETKPEPVPTPTETATPGPPPDPGQVDPFAPPPVEKGGLSVSQQQVQQQPFAMEQVGQYYAWTYCSACCPQGPDYCEQVGVGIGPTSQIASARAIEQCVDNRGIPQTCAANVQFFSGNEEDIPF
jgi:hypothetical protein